MLSKERNTFTFQDVFAGTYTFGVRTINSKGNRSLMTKTTITVGEAPRIEVAGGKGIAIGGIIDTAQFITDPAGLFRFDNTSYDLSPPAAPNNPIAVSGGATTYSQNCSSMPV